MKKLFILLFSFIIAFTTIAPLTGCGSKVSKKEVSDYLANASPETSALTFYVYDGSTTTIRYLFDKKSIRELLSDLSKVKALPVADYGVSKAAAPFYGISIGAGDLGEINILFAGGYAILGDGRGYEFDYDFGGVENRYAWQETDYIGGLALPCSYYISLGQKGWKQEFLTPSDSDVNTHLVVAPISESGSLLELQVTNGLGMDWRYGEYWHLEAFLDGTWYNLPLKKDHIVHDIAFELPMGESRKHTYDLGYYGDLPAGTYRLVIDSSDANAAYVFKSTFSNFPPRK